MLTICAEIYLVQCLDLDIDGDLLVWLSLVVVHLYISVT